MAFDAALVKCTLIWLKKRSQGMKTDKKSVDEEVTKPSKQVKRTAMHCVYYNALTTHSCSL